MKHVSRFGAGKSGKESAQSGIREGAKTHPIVDLKALYKSGQVVTGHITGIFKAGSDHPDSSASVALEGGGTALLLYNEIPDYPRNKLQELYQRGDKIEAEIVAVRPNKNRVTVSLKPVMRRRTIAQLEPGFVVLGTIVSAVNYGYFVSIGGGIEALLHRENLEEDHLDGDQSFENGAEIKVVILSIAEDGKRVGVGRKQLF